MELRQLRYLVTVVDEGSFTKAAHTLFVAQPGVSAQIKRLEEELGQTLLDRAGPRITPTAAGAELLPYARDALTAVEFGRESIEALAGLTRGSVHIGTVPNLAPASIDLAHLLGGFHRNHPGIDIRVSEGDATELAADVAAGRLDAALLSIGEHPAENLQLHTMTEDPVVAAATTSTWPDMPSRIDVPALADRDLIALPRGTGIRGLLDARFDAHGSAPRIAFEASDPAVLARFAHADLGVALIPSAYARELPHAPLHPPITGQIALAWRGHRASSRAALALITHLREPGHSTTG
jgi:DNA-binding transcriptional LysR family regulator